MDGETVATLQALLWRKSWEQVKSNSGLLTVSAKEQAADKPADASGYR